MKSRVQCGFEGRGPHKVILLGEEGEALKLVRRALSGADVQADNAPGNSELFFLQRIWVGRGGTRQPHTSLLSLKVYIDRSGRGGLDVCAFDLLHSYSNARFLTHAPFRYPYFINSDAVLLLQGRS